MRFPGLPRLHPSLLVFIGLGFAVGSAAFATGRSVGEGPGAAPAPIKCDFFLTAGTDNGVYTDVNDNQGVPVRLYRSKGFYEDVDHLIRFKKWVGGVALRSATPSAAFPGLTQNARGCIEFRAWTAQGVARHAQLWDSIPAKPPYTYRGKWICDVPPHDANAKPQWVQYPDDCDRSRLSVRTSRGEVSVESPAAGPARAFSFVAFSAEVERRLRLRGVPPQERASIVKAFTAPGPWYPCAQTGCCRAFEYE